MKRRLRALSEINKIIRKVDSSKIYIEKNIYMHIESIIERAKTKPQFHEQLSSYMFAHGTLFVNAHPLQDGILRYPENLSCPDWFILDLFKCPKFYRPEHVNEPLALFHNATESNGEILKYNDIVDMGKKNMDITVPLTFLEVHCKNIEEARKRVCTLAYITYDMRKEVFVKMFTKSMLEDPFFYSNIRKCWKHYNIRSVDIDLAKMSLTNTKSVGTVIYTPTRLEM